MYLKIGDLKLLKIKVMKDENCIYEGMVEDVPESIKETEYKEIKFESDCIIIKI